MDWSFLENAAPKPAEQDSNSVKSGNANITVRVDADCTMECDGEFVGQLMAGQFTKFQLPTGQHLIEFKSIDNPNIEVEQMVDWPEPDKNYLLSVNELRAKLAPAMQQQPQLQTPPKNPFLDQLNQMAQMNPLAGMNYGMPQMPTMPGMQQSPDMPPMPENK